MDDKVLFPEPSQLLAKGPQKLTTSSAKVVGRGDKVWASDMIPEMLKGKNGYPDPTWRLGELIHVLVSASIVLV